MMADKTPPTLRQRFMWWISDHPFLRPRNLVYGVKNLYRWRRLIWKDRDWDHSYLLLVMAHKLGQMETYHRLNGHTVDAQRMAKQMRVAKKLCERIADDNYLHERNLAGINKYGTKAWAAAAGFIAKQDIEMLGRMFAKHVNRWWD